MVYINIERTLRELKTDINILKPNSEKLVFRICKICKKEDIKKYRSVTKFKQNVCLNCSNKINSKKNLESRRKKLKDFWAKNVHPRIGKKHTKEALQKISSNRKLKIYTEEEKKKLREILKPYWGRKHTQETKEKLRKIATKNALRGEKSNFYGKTFYAKQTNYLARNGKIYNLKSSWELKVARHLDNLGIEWEYEKQFYPVLYEYNGILKEGTYIPDFFIGDEIWEIKGYWRKDALIKFEEFKKQYPDIKIKLLMKDDLYKMGIIL